MEADQEVVNLTRFSLFFPEKRQFFTETAGIFDFGKSVAGLGGDAAASDPGLLNIFYSRRIGLVDGQQVPIIGGGRLTGRSGPYAIGALNISTEEETLATRELDHANFTVLRLKRNVLKSSNIGVLFANSKTAFRTTTDRRRRQRVRARALRHDDRRDGEDVLAGDGEPGTSKDVAGVVDFAWKSDRFNYGGQYLDVGEHFNAEMGYIPRLDVRAGQGQAADGHRVPAGAASGSSTSTPTPTTTRITPASSIRSAEFLGACRGRTPRRSTSARPTSTTISQCRFATAGTILPVGTYEWQYATMSYSSNRTKRVYGIARRRHGRLLQRRSAVAARKRNDSGRQDAAVRAELHPQSRDVGRASALYEQRAEFPRQPLVLAGLLLEGIRSVTTTIARRRTSISCGGITTSPAAICMSSTTRVGIMICR